MIFVAIGIVAYALALVGICALCRAASLGDGRMAESLRDAGSVPLPRGIPVSVGNVSTGDHHLNETRRSMG